ncbi:MAG: TolC family protein, partial [Pedobacter sp.]
MSKQLTISILFLCLSISGFAQEKLSLREAITIALQNNYDIKISKNEIKIAQNNANIGNAGMLPTIEGVYSNGGSIQNTRQTPVTGEDRVIRGAR